MSYALWWIMHYEVMHYDLFNCSIYRTVPNMGGEVSVSVTVTVLG